MSNDGLLIQAINKMNEYEKELTALRAVAEEAEALSKRHDWHPELGKCICKQHVKFEDALKSWKELKP